MAAALAHAPPLNHQVRGIIAETQWRNPYDPSQNLVLKVSKSLSRPYGGISELGEPEAAGDYLIKQFILDYNSTRIGVQRNAEVLRAAAREGPGGSALYDFDVRLTSVADSNPLAAQPELRVPQTEWTRRVIETMGVANGQLYELRLQTDEDKLDQVLPLFAQVATSLYLEEKEAPIEGVPPALSF